MCVEQQKKKKWDQISLFMNATIEDDDDGNNNVCARREKQSFTFYDVFIYSIRRIEWNHMLWTTTTLSTRLIQS